MIRRRDITKANSEHYRDSPIIPPHILLIPKRFIQILINNPIFLLIEAGHRYESNCQTMSNNEIEQKNLNEIPYFLTILIFY